MFNQICKSHFAIKYEVILPCWTLGYHQIEIEQSPILTNGCSIYNFFKFLVAWILCIQKKLLLIAKTNHYLLQERAMRKKNMQKKSVNSSFLNKMFFLEQITFPFLSLHTINLCFLKISQQPKGSISILIITFVLGIQRIIDIDLYSSYISDQFRLYQSLALKI